MNKFKGRPVGREVNLTKELEKVALILTVNPQLSPTGAFRDVVKDYVRKPATIRTFQSRWKRDGNKFLNAVKLPEKIETFKPSHAIISINQEVDRFAKINSMIDLGTKAIADMHKYLDIKAIADMNQFLNPLHDAAKILSEEMHRAFNPAVQNMVRQLNQGLSQLLTPAVSETVRKLNEDMARSLIPMQNITINLQKNYALSGVL